MVSVIEGVRDAAHDLQPSRGNKSMNSYDPSREEPQCATASAIIPPDLVRSARKYVRWLNRALYEKALPANDRVRAAASCLAIAQEHHHSIVLLVKHSLYASSFALIRVVFEAYVRGKWLALCATDAQVQQFWKGREPPHQESVAISAWSIVATMLPALRRLILVAAEAQVASRRQQDERFVSATTIRVTGPGRDLITCHRDRGKHAPTLRRSRNPADNFRR